MKKNVIRICVFVICIIAIIATRYAYKVLSDVNVTKWDINGNKIYSCSGKDSNEQYHYYDENNRLIEYKSVIKGVLPETMHIYYDYDGDKKTGMRCVYDESPEKNHETKYVRINEKCVQHVDSSGSIKTYEYDENSNLIKFTNDDGTTTSYTYNEKGEKVLEEYSDGSFATYEYDSQGRLVKVTKGDCIDIWEYKESSNDENAKIWKCSVDGGLNFTIFISDENNVLVEVSNGIFVTQYKRITKYKYWKNGNMKSKKTYTLGIYDKKIPDLENE